MPETRKGPRPKELESVEDQEPRHDRTEKRSYYYDDACGYEDYENDPDSDDEDD